MNDKDKIKSYLFYLSVILIFLSGFLIFVDFKVADLRLYTFKVKGFYLTFTAMIINVFLFKTNKKDKMFISVLLLVFGYAYTIYTIMKAEIEFSMLDLGFYVYFGALIPLVIGLLLPGDKKEEKNEIKEQLINSSISDEIKESGEFLVCNYVTGLKGVKDIYKSTSILIKKKEDTHLEINIKAPEEIKMNIEDSNIEKIIISKSVTVNNSEQKTEDHTVETQYLATVLIGSFGAVVGQELAKETAGSKTNINRFYKIEILYKTDEENRIVFQTYKEPYAFFEKYSNILEKNE